VRVYVCRGRYFIEKRCAIDASAVYDLTADFETVLDMLRENTVGGEGIREREREREGGRERERKRERVNTDRKG
jgi:hypothetical protein